MKEALLREIKLLKDMNIKELQGRYVELFGEPKEPINNRAYLVKRIAYRLQELEYGGLAEKSKNKAQELIKVYDPVNNKALRFGESSSSVSEMFPQRDKRVPIPGSIISKNYKGQLIQVKVLEKGFEYNGKIYRTLTAVAKAITNASWNGFAFFNL
jgi:hypothetical protein